MQQLWMVIKRKADGKHKPVFLFILFFIILLIALFTFKANFDGSNLKNEHEKLKKDHIELKKGYSNLKKDYDGFKKVIVTQYEDVKRANDSLEVIISECNGKETLKPIDILKKEGIVSYSSSAKKKYVNLQKLHSFMARHKMIYGLKNMVFKEIDISYKYKYKVGTY